jgi:hypothetical protein
MYIQPTKDPPEVKFFKKMSKLHDPLQAREMATNYKEYRDYITPLEREIRGATIEPVYVAGALALGREVDKIITKSRAQDTDGLIESCKQRHLVRGLPKKVIDIVVKIVWAYDPDGGQ